MLAPDRIALAGEDVDRHVLADRREARRTGDAGQRVEHVDRELGRERKAAEGIGDIGVDLLLVARKPVEGGAGGLERLVEVAEPHLEDGVALAALAEPQALLAGDEPPERRDHRRLAARARKRHARERVGMLGDEAAPEERAQRMAEEDDRRARLLGGDQAVQGPEVADDLVPSALVGEMAEIGAAQSWARGRDDRWRKPRSRRR